VLLGARAAAAVVFFPLLLPVSEAIALLKVPFLIVPATGVGAATGTGNGFSLIELYLTGEVGTGNFLGDARAIAVCGRLGGLGFAGDLWTIVVFSLLVLSAEALLARRARRVEVFDCAADVTASSAVVVGAVAGLLSVPFFVCWAGWRAAAPRGLGSGGGDFVAGDFTGERGIARVFGDLGERTVLRG
jgi:hypothetical protein